MAKYRPVMIKIWNDSWFLSLTDQEKVFWFFLLTNPYFHISGIYELPKPLISPFQGGVEILTKFEKDGKVVYKEGWILIKNYLKNQAEQLQKKDNIYKSISSYLSENTQLVEMFDLINEDPYKTLIRPLGKEERGKRKVIKSKVIRLATPTRKETSFKKEDYNLIIEKYQSLKGIQLKGNEFKPVQQTIKSMFLSGRSKEDIVACMEFLANNPKECWQNWTINTILKQLPLFLAGKL